MKSAFSLQRYRREEKGESDDEFKEVRLDDAYIPYVPVRERRKERLAKLGIKLHSTKNHGEGKGNESSNSEEEQNSEEEEDPQALARKSNISLLDQHTELKRVAEGKTI